MNQVFKKGEEVIALYTASNWRAEPTEKGALYIVKDILYCAKCGQQCINVCGKATGLNGLIECGDCHNSQSNYDLWWTSSYYFVRPQDIEEAIERFASEEKYEICKTLKEFEENKLVKQTNNNNP